MSTFYEARILDPYGGYLTSVSNFVDPIDGGGAALEYVLNVGQVGVLNLTVPASVSSDLFQLDGRIGVWRSINGRSPALDGDAIYLIRKWRFGPRSTTITAYHANRIMKKARIAYNAGTAYTTKTAAPADDQIKAFARQNLGSGIVGADRDGVETQADISALVSIQVDLGLGASVAIQAARDNLFDVVQKLCQASITAGTYLACEIVAPTESTLELRTYAVTRGINRSSTSSGQPLVLSTARGSLENVELIVDHTDEETFIIAGGEGQEDARVIQTALDATRMGASPLNRIEGFTTANTSDATALARAADARLQAGRPIRIFTAELVETPATTRGIHFDLGDIVTAEHRGQQYDCRLDVVHVAVGGGQQRSRAQLRSMG